MMSLNLPVTLVTSGLCGLLFIFLSFHAAYGRMATKIFIGDGGDPTMLIRIRAHANFAEYVPLLLILLGICEAHDVNRLLLTICGAAIVVGRIMHMLGMPHPSPNVGRGLGSVLTWGVLLVLSVIALRLGLGI